MGWLERWDQRNQRTLEWHQHLYEEERRGARPPRPAWKWVAFAAGFAVLKLLRRVLEDAVGLWGTMAIGWGFIALCLYLTISEQRQKRRAWEAARVQSAERPPPASSKASSSS